MFKARVFTTDDPMWDRLVSRAENPDIYFTAAYARIYEQTYGPVIDEAFCGQAFLFVYGDEEEYLLYPFILRRINDLPFLRAHQGNGTFYDFITPYGYTGILMKTKKEGAEELVEGFLSSFKEYCVEQGIVTGFTRFHPLLKNQELFRERLMIEERGRTVSLDLRKEVETLLTEMNRKTRNLVRKAEKSGVVVERSEAIEDWEAFATLYLGTMRDRRAQEKYLFPNSFFEQSARLLGRDCSLFVARLEGRIISAALFIHKYGFIHYHLSGSDPAYRSFAPNNLILWKAMEWAKAQGFMRMHLGGGVRQDDTLHHFKKGFSRVEESETPFCTASVVYNEEAYGLLCQWKEEFDRANGKEPEKSDFFPRYRNVNAQTGDRKGLRMVVENREDCLIDDGD